MKRVVKTCVVICSLLLAGYCGYGQQINYLVPHWIIKANVTSGRFTLKSGASVPSDAVCISRQDAVSWLNIQTSYFLYSDGRMPVWQELVPAWGNTVQQQTLTHTGCNTGYTGSSVTYTIAANTYTDSTQARANALATAALSSGSAAYAAANGTCTVNTTKTVYAVLTKVNNVTSGTDKFSDLQVCFYSDAAHSVPLSVTNVVVNIQKESYDPANNATDVILQTTANGQCSTGLIHQPTYHKQGAIAAITDNIYYTLLVGDVYNK